MKNKKFTSAVAGTILLGLFLMVSACNKGNSNNPAPPPPPPPLPILPTCLPTSGIICPGIVPPGSQVLDSATGLHRGLSNGPIKVQLSLYVFGQNANPDPIYPYQGQVNVQGDLYIGPDDIPTNCPVPQGTFPVSGTGSYVNHAQMNLQLQVPGFPQIVLQNGAINQVPGGMIGSPSGAQFQKFISGQLYIMMPCSPYPKMYSLGI